MRKLKGGFIGPLGDDIPSIFPLITGIIILIASMAFLSNEISSKNDSIELRKSVLTISDLILQTGYISNVKFTIVCDEVKKYSIDRGYEVFMSLQKGCNTGIQTNKYTDIRSTTGDNSSTDLFCLSETDIQSTTNSEVASYDQIVNNATGGVFSTYPIAADCSKNSDESVKGIGRLNIVLYPRKIQ